MISSYPIASHQIRSLPILTEPISSDSIRSYLEPFRSDSPSFGRRAAKEIASERIPSRPIKSKRIPSYRIPSHRIASLRILNGAFTLRPTFCEGWPQSEACQGPSNHISSYYITSRRIKSFRVPSRLIKLYFFKTSYVKRPYDGLRSHNPTRRPPISRA